MVLKYIKRFICCFFFILGTVVSYALNPEKKNEDYTQRAIPSPALDQNASPESYIGKD